MHLGTLIKVCLIIGLSSCRIATAGSAQEGDKVVNVRAFGAKGNGVADDTVSIQAAINAAKTGETIYFPPGIYDVSNFAVKARSGLSFTGEGRKSVIRQKAGAVRIATFEASRDIVISNLTFDANGIVSFGGVVFYEATGVRIENNSFIDSAPKAIGSNDRYSFVFARGAVPSREIRILNNVIEDLQLEVDHSQKVVIDRNTVKRAVKTAGIGIFTIADGAIAEDYQITNNSVIDPIGAGFSVGIDPPTGSHCIFRRITISGNKVTRTKTSDYGVRIGTPDSSKKTTGNVFENIEIINNRFQIETGAPQARQLIYANTSDRAGIIFHGLIVSGNKIENKGPGGKGYAIDLSRIQKSLVADNTVKGVTSGISLSGELLSNEVRNNAVEASEVAYRLEGSLGGNRAANNRIVGKPKQGWMSSNLQASDAVEQ
jgi:Pectate lyase superfamily protein